MEELLKSGLDILKLNVAPFPWYYSQPRSWLLEC